MILAWYSWLKSERFWRWALYSLFFVGFITGLTIGSLLIVPFEPSPFAATEPTSNTMVANNNSYQSIGEGALSLKERYSSVFVPLLRDELEFVGLNSRPQSKEKERILLRLKSSGQELIAEQGKPFYLALEQTNDGKKTLTGFSKEKTVLQLTPFPSGEEELQIDLLAETAGAKEEAEILLPKKEAKEFTESRFVQEMRSGKGWGTDLFLSCFGGAEQKQNRNRQKIEFTGPDGTYFCYLAPQDYLIFDNGQWKEASQEEADNAAVVAQLVSLTPKLTMKLWDGRGFVSETIEIPCDSGPKYSLKPDQLPSLLRLHSASCVSCLFNKRRMLLKEGDWLIRTAQGWHHLARADEIDAYVKHKLSGELFVVDHLEKEDGKMVLKGRFFNEKRTQMQSISLPIATEKKSVPLPQKIKKL